MSDTHDVRLWHRKPAWFVEQKMAGIIYSQNDISSYVFFFKKMASIIYSQNDISAYVFFFNMNFTNSKHDRPKEAKSWKAYVCSYKVSLLLLWASKTQHHKFFSHRTMYIVHSKMYLITNLHTNLFYPLVRQQNTAS